MTVTIDATNMILINDAETAADWTSTNVTNTDGTLAFREGAGYQQAQASEETWESYDAITSEDYSGRTIFGWMLSGGPATETLDGFGMYLGDDTDNIVYSVGGSDNYGYFFQGWSSFRLNTADLPTNFRTIAGSEGSLTMTAITRIGVGGNFPGKAVGNSSNIKWDVMRYVANGNPALLVEGGTTGARGTFQEITTEDDSTANAWGIMGLLVPGSKTFVLQFGIQIGSLDSNAWFEDSDFQLIINGAIPDAGAGISAGSMDVDCVGNSAAGTNVVNLSNFFVQSIGAVSNWTMSADLDTAQWQDGQFVDCGTFTFPAADSGNKFVDRVIFTNCGQVTFEGTFADGCTFNGSSNALGAVFWDDGTTEENQDNLVFNSDGTGHAIHVFPVGAGPFTFNVQGYEATGYESATDTGTGNTFFLVDNALDADVTINLTGTTGDIAYERAAGYTGTVSLVNTVNLTVTVIDEAGAPVGTAQVSIHEGTDPLNLGAELMNADTNASGIATTTYNYGGDQAITIRIRKSSTGSTRYVTVATTGTIGAAGFSLTRTLVVDNIVEA